MGAWLNFNGSFFAEDEAIVPGGNRGLRYGDGLFETMKIINGEIQLSAFHFERLFDGMKQMQIRISKHADAAFFKEQIHKTVIKNKIQGAVRVRLMLFRGNGGLYETESTGNYLVECWPLSSAKTELNENGLHIGVYDGGRKAIDQLSNLKSNNYLVYVMGALYAKENKFNDCLILNTSNRVCESTISNIFWVKDKKISTPQLTEGCIAGVMRRHLLSVLPGAGYFVNEEKITLDQLQRADELFLTNAIGIRWVRSLNSKLFANNFTKELFHSTISPV
jgi:branched-chain amino acid aminotransferase